LAPHTNTHTTPRFVLGREATIGITISSHYIGFTNSAFALLAGLRLFGILPLGDGGIVTLDILALAVFASMPGFEDLEEWQMGGCWVSYDYDTGHFVYSARLGECCWPLGCWLSLIAILLEVNLKC